MMDMSQQSEERNRQKFAEKMRQKSLTARNAKLAGKKASGTVTPSAAPEGDKKD
jgi:hypothetical protein